MFSGTFRLVGGHPFTANFQAQGEHMQVDDAIRREEDHLKSLPQISKLVMPFVSVTIAGEKFNLLKRNSALSDGYNAH